MERKKITQQLPDINGPLLVFGGVYSNLQALQALYKKAEELKIPKSNIICTGDIAGYCAQPEECLQLIKDWGIATIFGNVEIQLREDENDCGCDFTEGGRCNIFSKNWFPFAAAVVSQSTKDWLHTLPDFLEFQYAGKKCIVIHGSLAQTAEYIFKSTAWDVKEKVFNEAKASLVLAGHSGLPFAQRNENKLWLNSGALGMPANDAGTHVWYVLLNADEKSEITYQFQQLDYDYHTASDMMLEKGLPAPYAKTLETGLWDNCEILPEEEAEMQGREIVI